MFRHFVVLMAIGVAITFSGCSRLGQYVANTMYGDLDLPIDREAAISVTSLPPSTDIRAVIGGKAEGLDCSIPSLVESFMFERVRGKDAPISLQFRQGCVTHDYCYRHGYATYGYTQADCDLMLLQAAFRTCIQIYDMGLLGLEKPNSSNRPKSCETRAREVLLGVRMGGWDSFKAREKSSYFEFDPLPLHADNYTVARLARVPRDRAPLVDGESLLSTPITFNFSRGRVEIRELQWTPGEPLGRADIVRKKTFPANVVPTPPNVVRIGERDLFVLLNRESDHNTGFIPLIDSFNKDVAKNEFNRLECSKKSAASKDFEDTAEKEKKPCDFDASIIRLVPRSELDTSAARFFAFTHRFADKIPNADQGFYYTIGIHWWDMPETGIPQISSPMKMSNAGLRQLSYRFLQSEVHVGEFRKRGCPEVVALGRGIHLDPKNPKEARTKSATADDYKSLATLAFIPFTVTNCPVPELLQISLPQAEEPAVPVSKGSHTTDRLLTMSVAGGDGSVRIKEYDFGGQGGSQHEAKLQDINKNPLSLESTWIKSAAYVVRGGAQGDLLFFSRVILDPKETELFERGEGDGPNSLNIEFRYFESSEVGWTERGHSSCKIDLEKQHNTLPKHSQKRELYKRQAEESRTYYPLDVDNEFKRLHKQEMVRH